MENFVKGSPLLIFSICFLHCVHQANSKEFTGLNFALGKPTWQYPPGFGPSNRAVDGNTNSYYSKQSCSHTADKQSEKPASWSVDLMELFYITGIKIFNRIYHGDRLRRFRLYGHPGNVTLYDDATQLSPQYKNVEIHVPLDSDKRYRNITVYLPTVEGDDTVLTLCEVQIYGGCKLPVVDNGFVINANGSQMNSKIVVTYGTKLKVICSPGHQLGNEDNTLICRYNYTWDKPKPVCKAFACERLTLNNGNYTYNQSSYNNFFPFGSVATAECDKGFKLQGPRQRTCLSDDLWDDGNTHCTIMCDHPGGFDHGNYTKNSTDIYLNGSVVYSTKIETICEKGYILNSSQTVQRQCTAHGNWSGSTPKCSPVKCDELENTTNSMFRILNSTYNIYPGYRSTIEWICNGDYYTVAETQTCTENGLWSGKRPACKKHEEAGLQVKVIAGLSGGVVAVVLAVLALLIVLKKRYGALIQQSSVYMSLSARPGAVSQEAVYMGIAGQRQEEDSKKTPSAYENTVVTEM